MLRLLKRYVSWNVEGIVRHTGPAKVGQFIALMETGGCRSSAALGNKATGHGRHDAGQELEGSAMKIGSAGVWGHHVHQHGPARSAVQLEDGDAHDCKASGDREVAASEDCEVFGGQTSAGGAFMRTRTR